MKNKLLQIVSSLKTIEFEIVKDCYKNELILQITKINGDKAEGTDKKVTISQFQK